MEKAVDLYLTIKSLEAIKHSDRPGHVRKVLKKVDESLKGMGVVYCGDGWETNEYKLRVRYGLSEDDEAFVRHVGHQVESDVWKNFEVREVSRLLEIIRQLMRR